jgi:hypothetical protein
VMVLLLLLSVVLVFHHWLIEPLIGLSSTALELRLLPWLVLIGAVWLLAGESKGNS